MIHIDTHYVIGHSHLNNEDFAIAGDEFPYVILSDGCSSSDHSDIGARMVAMAASEYLDNHLSLDDAPDPECLATYVALKSEAAARVIGAPASSIDATLLIAYVKNDTVYVYAYGDGSLLIESTRGIQSLTTIDYSHNAPYYPAYRANAVRNREYIESSQGEVKTVNIDGTETISPVFEPTVLTFPVSELGKLILFSDGVSSFINTQSAQSIETASIANDLSSFRNTKGDFVKRKVKRVLKNFAKAGVFNSDDISVAAMIFQQEEGV